jgi:hypothetical protein
MNKFYYLILAYPKLIVVDFFIKNKVNYCTGTTASDTGKYIDNMHSNLEC